MDMIFDIIGWIGALLVVLAYFLVSTKKFPPHSRIYQLMNLFGAIGVGINSFIQKAYPSVGIQIVWILIAIYGLYKASKA